jgi:DNA-binding SARP family transcriptional activator/pimeloyl-ACP methyl ester carboxylesterase
MWRLTLFGAPTLVCNGRTQPLPRRKARALLSYLAVTSQTHTRETVAALLWPDHEPQQGRADLSRILSNLRTTLGIDYILADREHIALNDKAALWIDVVHFRRQLDACREQAALAMDEDDCENLAATVACYQADFLAGFTLPDCPAFDEWQLLQTEALRHDLSWALDRLVDGYEAQNKRAQAISYAQRWVGLDPLHELAQRRLLALYARNGQRAEAHRHYLACERLLAEALGVKPELETQQLYEQILRSKPDIPVLQTAPAPKADQEIRYFLSPDKARIAYAIVGQGPPLVWTATFLRHLEFDWQSPIWQHWLAALASRHTLIRYDERACGLSDWSVDDISFEAWIRDLEALVDHLGLERFRLMALSQAGAVAIAYAARHPERLSHLILHGAYARGRFHRQDNPQASEEAETLLSLTKLGWGQDNPAFRQVFSMQLMPGATKEQLAWFDELMRISMTSENAVRAEAEMYHINVLDQLPAVSVPTLVTHCREDAAVPFAEGRILASQIPGAQFVPLDSKNHLLLPAEPAWEQFVRQIHRFLAAEPEPFAGAPAAD